MAPSVSFAPLRRSPKLAEVVCPARCGAGPALRCRVGWRREAAAAVGQRGFLLTGVIPQRASVRPEAVIMAALCHGQDVLGAGAGRGCARRVGRGDSRATARPPGAGGPPEGWDPAPGGRLSAAPVLPTCSWVRRLPRAAAQCQLLGVFA